MDSQFRIGGVYRQHAGQLVQLHPSAEIGMAAAVILRMDGEEAYANGLRTLSDGRSLSMQSFGNHGNGCDLLPGELHQVNGEWVPVEEVKYCADELALQKLIESAGLDQIQEAYEIIEIVPPNGATTVVSDEDCASPERLFAPLPKPEPKADRWAGFIVHKDNSPRLPEVEQHKLASLGSMSHQLGSAWKK